MPRNKTTPDADALPAELADFDVYKGRKRRLPNETASISPRGTIGLSSDLAAALKGRYVRLFYKKSRGLAILPCTEAATGAIKGQKKPDDVSIRFNVFSPLRIWGLAPQVQMHYRATWNGTFILIDLAQGREAKPRSSALPTATKDAAELSSGRPGHEACPECGKDIAYRIKNGRRVFRKHTDPDGVRCPPGAGDD